MEANTSAVGRPRDRSTVFKACTSSGNQLDTLLKHGPDTIFGKGLG